jgi:hypothetical protein
MHSAKRGIKGGDDNGKEQVKRRESKGRKRSRRRRGRDYAWTVIIIAPCQY